MTRCTAKHEARIKCAKLQVDVTRPRLRCDGCVHGEALHGGSGISQVATYVQTGIQAWLKISEMKPSLADLLIVRV